MLTPTLTVTNLPVFATHNTGTQDFTVLATTDLGLVGAYVVTMTSSVTFYDDFTMTTQTTLTASYTFTIFMTPCVIYTYTDTVTVGTLTYFIGDPTLTDGPYEFT